jgi:hypothetical protein
MAIPLPGLNPTPAADDPQPPGYLAANAMNVTRVGGLGALIAAVATAAGLVFPTSATAPLVLQVTYAAAKGTIIATALIAVAVMIAADVRARATASAAAGRSAGAADSPGAALSAVPSGSIGASMVALPCLLVRVTGVAGPATALAVRSAAAGGLEYLVARPGAQPAWRPEASIELVSDKPRNGTTEALFAAAAAVDEARGLVDTR